MNDTTVVSPAAPSSPHELALAYHDLGTAVFALAHHGALRDPRLASRVRRIYELSGLREAPGNPTQLRPPRR
jgi:hypothetical protein